MCTVHISDEICKKKNKNEDKSKCACRILYHFVHFIRVV